MSPEPTFWSLIKEHWHLAHTLRSLKIHFYPEKCRGVWECYQVCPVGCWTPDLDCNKVIFHNEERCIACGACVLQCPQDAIQLA